jgi:hypothetical protein
VLLFQDWPRAHPNDKKYHSIRWLAMFHVQFSPSIASSIPKNWTSHHKTLACLFVCAAESKVIPWGSLLWYYVCNCLVRGFGA